MLKKTTGYLLLVLATLTVIGTLITIPNTLEVKTTPVIAGRLVGMVILFFVAFLLFRIGRKYTKATKQVDNGQKTN